MHTAAAAAVLGVAEHEVLEVRLNGGQWEALHHDMASHEETWRTVGAADEPELAPVDEPVLALIAEQGPEVVQLAEGETVTPKKRSGR